MARKSRSHSKDNNLLMFNFNSRKATFTCSIGMMTKDKEKGWINTLWSQCEADLMLLCSHL